MESAKSKNRLRPAMKDPLLAILLSALIILLAGTGTTPADERSISLKRVGTYASGIFDAGGAEIVAHDPKTQRLFVVNARSRNH